MNSSVDNLPKDASSAAAENDNRETASANKHSQIAGLPLIAWIVIGVVIIVLLGAVFAWRMRPPEFHGVLIQSPDEAADFTLMTSNGEPMSLSDFRGKQVMLYFGYTFCPDVCPTTLNDLSIMMEELGPKKAKDVQVIMVSVDPERDSVEQLASYMPHFDPSFLGMTGSLEEIQDIASQYGIYFERQEGDTAAGYLVDHTAVVTLVDDKGHVKMVFPYGTTGKDMAADVSYMMR